jgi:YggT family protein
VHVLASLINALINLYIIMIAVYVAMSWIPRKPSGAVEDVRSVLGTLCEPFLAPFRRVIPPIAMVDFSPFVAIIVLEVVAKLVVAIL